MILKVNKDLKSQFWEYVSYEESINIFIIGDVESYGFDTEFQEVWFQLDNEKNITSLILRYYSSLIIYSYKNDFDVDELIEHINSLDIKVINGKKSVIDKLIGKYTNFKYKKESYFCSLKNISNMDFSNMDNYKIEEALTADLEDIYSLLSEIEDFKLDNYVELKKHQLKTNSARVYLIKENNKVISTCATGIENSFLAMVNAVATDEKYRNRGLATYIVYKISKHLLEEGKTPCLLYCNKEVSNIYRSIGYREEDKWVMIYK
ncbi:MAG: GNAT family N-acetyltransferase [Romboutsia sp.]